MIPDSFPCAAVTMLLGLSAWAQPLVSAPEAVRELIPDPHFERGFILWKPEPGKHVRYGEMKGLNNSAPPVWGLDQWSSRYPLDPTPISSAGALSYSNQAKAVILGASGSPQADLVLAINTGAEYSHTRRAGEPWVHLLVEQEFDPPAPLQGLQAAKLHVEARLLRSRLLQGNDYSPALHAAQFTIYFTLQNRNHQSAGYGDLVWFGVPLYDNRSRFPRAFKEQDFGGTAKFIFTEDGKAFTATSAHDGGWVVIDKDLLPLMHEALKTAWARGFLKDSKNVADYSIGGMNMGWELPGTFDVAMQVRNMSLKTITPRDATNTR